MEKTSKVLPDNCLVCPNHRQTRAWADGQFLIGRIDVRCQLNQGLIVVVGVSKDVVVPPPEWCPLTKEEQPWGNNTPILGYIWIKIEKMGEVRSIPTTNASTLPLIDRANLALAILTGGRESFPLERVSTDLKARRAVFRRERTI